MDVSYRPFCSVTTNDTQHFAKSNEPVRDKCFSLLVSTSLILPSTLNCPSHTGDHEMSLREGKSRTLGHLDVVTEGLAWDNPHPLAPAPP